MNAEQSRSVGKVFLCFPQRTTNQFFLCLVENIVISSSSHAGGLLLEYAHG